MSKKFKPQFEIVLESLDKAGYNNHYQILKASDYGMPQARERVFIVSIRKDVDNGHFKFPEPFELKVRLKDMLDDEVDKKYYLSEKLKKCFLSDGTGKYPRRERFLQNLNRSNQHIANTLTTLEGNRPTCTFIKFKKGVITADDYEEDMTLRKLTPKECFRLMGFDDEDFEKAEKVCSNTQLYKQAGNSIVVDVLEHLFKEIMEVLDVKKIDEVKTITYECDDLIDLALLKEKEPELYEELLADYPAENATYIFKNKTA
jgi:DNA (cytosine-5)-methyltransferase 1